MERIRTLFKVVEKLLGYYADLVIKTIATV